jgi:hypothetical protein
MTGSRLLEVLSSSWRQAAQPRSVQKEALMFQGRRKLLPEKLLIAIASCLAENLLVGAI